MIKKQFTLYLENKPNTLATVMQSMAAAKINIEGMSVSESTDIALVQMVASQPDEAKRVLTESDVAFTVQNVSVISLQHVPGSLSEMVSRLSQGGVTINYIYATGCSCGGANGCGCYAVIGADNLERVEEFWKSKA